MEDLLCVSFDSNEQKNEHGLCVARPSKDGSYTALKMLLDKQAKDLYRAITDQSAKVIVLPDNPTNGDVIKAVFPNAKVEIGRLAAIVDFSNRETDAFFFDWWNAPYKREVEE